MNPNRIGPDDPRYRAILDRQFNERFPPPDYVRIATSTEAVVAAVSDAVSEGRRLVVTSGGHCLEGFVSDPEVGVIVDVSPMKRVYYDARHRAIAIEAGATVGEAFKALHEPARVRSFYRDLFADSGGVPVPGDAYEGAFKENYPRLQHVKARWDPRNVFHHALSIPVD